MKTWIKITLIILILLLILLGIGKIIKKKQSPFNDIDFSNFKKPDLNISIETPNITVPNYDLPDTNYQQPEIKVPDLNK
jgi:hypothetical protein